MFVDVFTSVEAGSEGAGVVGSAGVELEELVVDEELDSDELEEDVSVLELLLVVVSPVGTTMTAGGPVGTPGSEGAVLVEVLAGVDAGSGIPSRGTFGDGEALVDDVDESPAAGAFCRRALSEYRRCQGDEGTSATALLCAEISRATPAAPAGALSTTSASVRASGAKRTTRLMGFIVHD